MKTWKRNAIIAGVLVLICAGVYLNWLYGDAATPELTKTLDASKVMGESTLVINDGNELASPVAVQSSADEYFAKLRLSRQEARDEAVQLLQETIAYSEGEGTGTTSAQLEAIVANALTESEIESLVIAKGYRDCVAYISEDSISLAVASNGAGLSATDVSLLSDIVMSQTKFNLSQIRVVPVE